MTSLGMIRHGPTEWTNEKRLQGHTDIPLSAEGREMVSGWRIPLGIGDYHWVSSPLRRTKETAQLLGAKNLKIEHRIKEMNYGDWEGSRLNDLRSDLGEAMAENEAKGLDFRPEGGESPREVQVRLVPWLLDVAGRGQPTVAVAHNGILRALFSLATGWNMVGPPPEKFQWGAIHYFQIDDIGRVSVDRINVSLVPS